MTDAARATVDRDACFSYGRCVEVAPTAFALDDQGKSVPANAGSPVELLRVAVEECPMQAISILASDGRSRSGEPLQAAHVFSTVARSRKAIRESHVVNG